jgi:Ca2+-binding EF-hand superfamily protein
MYYNKYNQKTQISARLETLREDQLLTKFRKELLKRGTAGIKSISVYFRQIDSDGSRTISYDEFQDGVRTRNINLTKDEIQKLFRLFDTDNSGNIDYNEFLVSVRVGTTMFYHNLPFFLRIASFSSLRSTQIE